MHDAQTTPRKYAKPGFTHQKKESHNFQVWQTTRVDSTTILARSSKT
jgi:hypothetical protein